MRVRRIACWAKTGARGAAPRLVAVAFLLAGAACSVDTGIVGGVCAEGYTDCNNVCVLTGSDSRNCGACGEVCATGACVAGSCAGTIDARVEASAGRDAMRIGRDDARSRRDAIGDGAPRHDGSVLDGPADGSGRLRQDATTADAVYDVADGPRADAGHADGAQADAHATDARARDALVRDAQANDVQVTDAPTRDGPGDGLTGLCAPPYITVASCGACGAACQAGQVCGPPADAGPDATSYGCVDECSIPYIACDGTCIDDSSDPANCGACGASCPSGICVMGVCAGSAPGNIVVIGHDYAAPGVRVSEARLLSNAVFLPPSNPLRVIPSSSSQSLPRSRP